MKLFLFPGLACDNRMFDKQKEVFSGLEPLSWITPKEDDSVSDYARRLVDVYEIPQFCHMGGVSFGSMMAQEVAEIVQAKRVYVISGIRSSADFPPLRRMMMRFVTMFPPHIFLIFMRLFRAPYHLQPINDEQLALFQDMSKGVSPYMLRWALKNMSIWQGAELGSIPVTSIHGDADRLIPMKKIHPDYVISGGGHLIVMTHYTQVNEILKRYYTS